MPIFVIICAILFLSVICTITMFYRLGQQAAVRLSPGDYLKLGFSGIIAFIADTVGVGSFAVNVALAKLLGTFADEELPAVNNGAQVIPGTIEALFFMQLVDVDWLTLVTLVTGASLGGLLGGVVVSRLSKQAIRLSMLICFLALISLLIGHQLHLMPIGGDLIALHSWKLVVGFLGMIICGSLTSVGIGLFVLVQSVLFLLDVSPLIAFPIMTAAGAMQQPLTTLVFLQQNKIPLKKTLILSFSGCIGVLLALPLFVQLSADWLHRFLLIILIYNFYAMSRAWLRARASKSRTPAVPIAAAIAD